MKRVHRVATVFAVLALGAPIALAAWVHARTDELADHLAARAGMPARIGAIDADLTGTIRLADVAVGELFAAESVEASVAVDALLSGQLAADEVRVAAPHIAIKVDRDGDSDFARLVRRLSRAPGGGRSKHVLHVVVSRGTLTAHVTGVGDISALGVELVPDARGVRIITGNVRIRAGTGPLSGEIELARSAAELSLPRMSFRRVLAVAGTGILHVADRSIALREIAIARLAEGGLLEARGFLDDSGVLRAIAAEIVPPTPTRPGFALSLAGTNIPLAPFAVLAPHAIAVDDARATGYLTVRKAGGAIAIASDVSLTGVRLEHSRIAPVPVVLDSTIAAAITIAPHAVVVEHATIAIGAAHWTASGWVRRVSPISGQLDLRLAEAPCMALFEALPAQLRAPLDGIAMTGTFAGRARLAIDLAAPPGSGVELDASIGNHCDVAAEPPAADVTVLARKAHGVEVKKLPAYVRGAFVSAEDGRFYEHDGFDLYQIARSLEIDLRDQRLTRGGSTISQQLVKNELLTQRRSLDRKIQEALLTWRLEQRLPKQAILQRYLDIIELGPHVIGLTAAARYWFDISPRDLSIKQAAFLAALTSEPQSMSRRVRHAGGLDADTAARIEIVLRAMRRDGVIDKDEFDTARAKSLHFSAVALHHEL